jgi:hypothetical protein
MWGYSCVCLGSAVKERLVLPEEGRAVAQAVGHPLISTQAGFAPRSVHVDGRWTG